MTNTPNASTETDLIDRLRAAARGADDLPIADVEALLMEAADLISAMRVGYLTAIVRPGTSLPDDRP